MLNALKLIEKLPLELMEEKFSITFFALFISIFATSRSYVDSSVKTRLNTQVKADVPI